MAGDRTGPSAPITSSRPVNRSAGPASSARPSRGQSAPQPRAAQPAPKPRAPVKPAPQANVIRREGQVNKTVQGKPYRSDTSWMTYSQATMNNARKTDAGRRADAMARKASGAGDGRVAGHRHSASGGAPPGDTANLYRQNSIQNAAGGTKHYVERMRDKAVQKDGSLKIEEGSTLVHSPTQPGYGNKVPIAEKVRHIYVRDGKVAGRSNVIFANTSSSASRAADKAKSEGKTLSKTEKDRLDALDREHFGTTTAQDQARASQMRADGKTVVPDRATMAQRAAGRSPARNVYPLRPAQKPARTPKMR